MKIPRISIPHALRMIVPAVIVVLLYVLTIRGNWGNPTPHEIEYELSTNGQAFETSQERSRFAMILALFHERRIAIDSYASMGTPDIGFIHGHYYSFFPPGASLLALPLFLLSNQIGATQLAVFSLSTMYAIGTMLLIIAYCRRLGLRWPLAMLAAISFAFATNAWGYSVTFYAHLISAFYLLLGLYVLSFSESWKGALMFWFSYAIAVFVDFPNLLIFFPMAVLQSLKMIQVVTNERKTILSLNIGQVLAPLLFIGLMLCYGYYNYVHFGSATRLSNTIPRVKDLKEVSKSNPESGREAVGALNTRNMLEGFRSFVVSRDRGLLFYTPLAFLSFLAIGALRGSDSKREVLLFTVPLTCLVLYTMFGDPYGGWAFGSRYILAVQPEFMILAVVGLQRFWHTRWARPLFSIAFAYSTAVSALAPLTTNVIPPYVEARYLNLASDYRINWQMLQKNELNSLVYNHVLGGTIPGVYYYYFVAGVAIVFGLACIWLPMQRRTRKASL